MACGMGEKRLVFVEFRHRQQFHRGDAQVLQIADFFAQAAKGAGTAQARGGMPGKAAHVQLVDNGVLNRRTKRPVPFPVVALVVDAAAGRGAQCGPPLAPGAAIQSPGIGIQQNARGVVGMAVLVRPADAIAVAQCGGRVDQENMPDIAGFVHSRIKRKEHLPCSGVWQRYHQRHRFGVAGEEREIDALRGLLRAQRQGRTGPGLNSAFHKVRTMFTVDFPAEAC